jgi:hypothetical protein
MAFLYAIFDSPLEALPLANAFRDSKVPAGTAGKVRTACQVE